MKNKQSQSLLFICYYNYRLEYTETSPDQINVNYWYKMYKMNVTLIPMLGRVIEVGESLSTTTNVMDIHPRYITSLSSKLQIDDGTLPKFIFYWS